jgi:hypothetical protein
MAWNIGTAVRQVKAEIKFMRNPKADYASHNPSAKIFNVLLRSSPSRGATCRPSIDGKALAPAQVYQQTTIRLRKLQNSLFCHSREVSGGNPHCNHLKSWMPDKTIRA